MKDYLNYAETKELTILVNSCHLADNFINGNVMTKDEKTKLKRAVTTIKNVAKGLIKRLGEQQAKKFYRTFTGSEVIVITNSELEVLQKRKYAEIDRAFEENKEYFNLVELALDMNCKNCTKCYKECDLYKHFDEQEILPMDERTDLGNCKYAYKEIIKHE